VADPIPACLHVKSNPIPLDRAKSWKRNYLPEHFSPAPPARHALPESFLTQAQAAKFPPAQRLPHALAGDALFPQRFVATVVEPRLYRGR